MTRFQSFVYLFLIASMLVVLPSVSSAQDICRRQNLVGNWINPEAGPGDILRVRITYRCSYHPSTQFAVSASLAKSGDRETWMSPMTGKRIGEQNFDQPTKIGASWNPSDNCIRVRRTHNLKFWHVITTWSTAGLKVLYRGRDCANKPFVRQFTLQREPG